MKYKFISICMLLLIVTNSTFAGSVPQFGVIDRNGAFFSLLERPLWDPSETSTSFINSDGTLWVKSEEDGRIRAGTWQLGADGKICLNVGGVIEGCFVISKHEDIVRFYLPEADFAFTLQPRKGMSVEFLTWAQKQIYKALTRKRGLLDLTGAGDEYIYWQENGLTYVVQPNGSIKTGGWWFTSNGGLCDNVNGAVDCFSVKEIRDNAIILTLDSESNELELNIRIDERPETWTVK